ncbi:hypothetical protein NXW05_06160 [Phocaeicola vulgatus]|nr:hypothetical protein [Phocaeicola vulgatus]
MKSPVLSILFLLISVTLLAVPNDFRFRHFSVEDGLSSNSVRAIMQDKYGFLWIGTEEGLNRYDGIMIKSYSICPQANRQIHILPVRNQKEYLDRDR